MFIPEAQAKVQEELNGAFDNERHTYRATLRMYYFYVHLPLTSSPNSRHAVGDRSLREVRIMIVGVFRNTHPLADYKQD